MPIDVRVCADPCNAVRFAECSTGCRLPVASDPESWRQNMQEGAGTMQAGDAL